MNLGLYDLLAKAANQFPDKQALITNARALSYHQLLCDVDSAAECLNQLGLMKNEPIGIAYHNSIEFVTLLFACAKLKIPAVLLGVYLKQSELMYYIKNIGIGKVIASNDMDSVMRGAGRRIELLEKTSFNFWSFPENCKAQFNDGDLYCQLTSGTNGMSKASIRTEEAIINEIKNTIEIMQFTHNDSFITLTPIHHSYGLIAGTLAPLTLGAQLYLAVNFVPADIIHEIDTRQSTVMLAVPYMYHLFSQTIRNRNVKLPAEHLLSLRYCISAGASMHETVESEFYDVFGKKITQDYGSTETGVMCINKNLIQYKSSVGVPVGDSQIKAFNDAGEALPENKTGELRIKSKSTARAYIYPVELNQDAFHDGWFSTGDLGYVNSTGCVFVVSRKTNIINVAGMKVDPIEVENIIMKIPGVVEAAVVGVDMGPSGQAVKAYIVSERKIDDMDIVLFCKENISHFKIPKYIEFVDKLPKSQTGKVIRKYLIGSDHENSVDTKVNFTG